MKEEPIVWWSFTRVVLICASALLAVKVLLIPCYTSTDFEVHRNWLAITHHLPIAKWYYEATSQWTLDYPPLFAYFERLLSWIGSLSGLEDILILQKEPLFNKRVLYFQRATVILTDLFYLASCALLCSNSCAGFSDLPKSVVSKARLAAFVLLSTNVGLILVDNIHFQYNSLLSSFLILVLYFTERKQLLPAAFLYIVLVNFKHIYLYYAPAFVFYYLRHYFEVKQTVNGRLSHFSSKALILATVISAPFIISFGPFLFYGGLPQLQQIFSRLFPVSRGLTHAYWAPNAWALYNFVDLVSYRVCSLLKIGTFVAPTYSSGLVQEHSHSVLPSISPVISLILVVASLLPLGLLLMQKKKTDLSVHLVLSALSFFFFGYHVHEKALLLVSIPLIVAAFSNPRFVPVCVLFSAITTFSLFPLLYTLFEVPIKYGLGSSYFLLTLIMFRSAFSLRPDFILPTFSRVYLMGLIVIELYNTFFHKILFGSKLEFLPLMFVSVYNAMGVLTCYLWIVKLAIEDEYLLYYKKKRCEITEELIRQSTYAVQSIESIEEVQIVAGVDISTSKTNSQFAVVSLTVFSYPNLKHLSAHEEVTLITEPYITDYLAIREADVIADVIRRFMAAHPELRPDVVICDGNGKFHSRGCGVASHIGALSGVASIGVAKNLNLSLLKKVGADASVLEKVDKLVDAISLQSSDGFAPFDVLLPVSMNIVRLGGSKVPVFVSAGYGIELDLSTQIVQHCARNRICEPVRMADLRSREKVRELFDT